MHWITPNGEYLVFRKGERRCILVASGLGPNSKMYAHLRPCDSKQASGLLTVAAAAVRLRPLRVGCARRPRSPRPPPTPLLPPTHAPPSLQAPPPPPGAATVHFYDPVRAPPPPPSIKRAAFEVFVRNEVRPRVLAICEGGLEGTAHQAVCMAVAKTLSTFQPIAGAGVAAPFCEQICWHSCDGDSHADGGDDGFHECPSESCAQASCLEFLLRRKEPQLEPAPRSPPPPPPRWARLSPTSSVAGSAHRCSRPTFGDCTTRRARSCHPARPGRPRRHRHRAACRPGLRRHPGHRRPARGSSSAPGRASRTGTRTAPSFRTRRAAASSPTTRARTARPTCCASPSRRASRSTPSRRASWWAPATPTPQSHRTCTEPAPPQAATRSRPRRRAASTAGPTVACTARCCRTWSASSTRAIRSGASWPSFPTARARIARRPWRPLRHRRRCSSPRTSTRCRPTWTARGRSGAPTSSGTPSWGRPRRS